MDRTMASYEPLSTGQISNEFIKYVIYNKFVNDLLEIPYYSKSV